MLVNQLIEQRLFRAVLRGLSAPLRLEVIDRPAGADEDQVGALSVAADLGEADLGDDELRLLAAEGAEQEAERCVREAFAREQARGPPAGS